jgi:CheY-like chemotaxis protein
MERYLAGTPYRFAGVRDTRNAVAMAEKIRPGAIVLDVMMPEKDGWNLLGQFRQHPAIKDIPVIVCTILAQRDLALALGADDFLRKPVSRQILLAALGCLLASQSKASG